ncbi:HAMP domain-containing protein [Fusibacter ferrireducens]|uniref:HAMP domain-containing protein n=1 Tax=Fusibacter ferrireducens TaxID=2785058 RepID=A0ABR9ZNK6_9FIRM|nr:HAMP domain-containing protein [Fusibacter ferrireducens]MBF4692047.1 HAMP domain-containing protein [Fusibacter ferrireducens]
MRKIIVLVLLTVLLSGFFTYLLENLDLEYVIDVLAAPEDQMVILQKQTSESMIETFINALKPTYNLIHISKEGQILKTYPLPKDAPSTFSDYDNLSMDDDGNLYLHRSIKNADNYYVFSEEIIKIAPDSLQSQTIYKVDYQAVGAVEYALINKAYLVDHHLFVIQKKADDLSRVIITQINIYNESIHVIKDLKFDPTLYVKDILYLTNGRIIFSTVKGTLYQYYDENFEVLKYDTMPELVQVSRLNSYDHSTFAFMNELTGNIVKMDTDQKRYDVIRTSMTDISKIDKLKYKDANLVTLKDAKSISGNIRLNNAGKRFVFIDREGSVIVMNDVEYSRSHNMRTFIKHFFVIGLFALAIGFMIYAYEKSRGSLVIKFLTILLPLVLLIPVISLTVSFGYFTNLAKNDLFAELFNFSRERASKISADHLLAIDGLEDYANLEYNILTQERAVSADEFTNLNLKTYDRWYYSVIYKYEGDKIHVVTGDGIEFWATTQYLYGERSNQAYVKAVTENRTILSDNSDVSGEWVFAVTPIRTTEGQVIGLLEVGTGKKSYTYHIQGYYGRLVTLNLIIVSFILLLMSIVIYRMILPLRNLNDSVDEISGGNWGVTVPVHTHDEIGELSGMFNKMSLFIKDYISELTKMNAIYFKFIPLKFFELLDKKSITEVELGNYSKQEMTVVYINTANYFELVRGKNSKEQLDILNKLFEEYAKSIHAQNGLVGEFRNAGVLALFTKEEEAMSTAAMIMQHIGAFDLPVKTNISIHLGEILLGIVGDENRLTTSVISECVNEVTEMNKIATKFDTGVLLSDAMVSKMNEHKDMIRYIGQLEDAQSHKMIKLHEWLETLPISTQKDYIKTKTAFESALHSYELEHYDASKRDFISVIKSNRRDLVSKEYLFKCENLALDPNNFEKPLGRY